MTKALLFFFASMNLYDWAEAVMPVKDLGQDYRSLKVQVEEVDRNQRRILGSLYSTNRKIKKISEKHSFLTQRMLHTTGNMKSLARGILDLNSKIKRQRSYLSRRIRTLYTLGEQNVARTIFSSQSAHDLDRNMKFLKIMADQDYQMIKEYERLKEQLSERNREMRREVVHLAEVQKDIRYQEDILLKEQFSKKKLIDQLRTQKVDKIEAMKVLRAQGYNLTKGTNSEGLWLMESRMPFFEMRGRLKVPIQGELLKSYGVTVDAEYRYKLLSKGNLYQADEKTDVHAVAEGQVAYVGNLTGVGPTVVIDHGDNYYTVYGCNRDLKVKRGDSIQEGQVVGRSGFCVDSQNRGLYFEIRHFSDALDPSSWLAKDQEVNGNFRREQ